MSRIGRPRVAALAAAIALAATGCSSGGGGSSTKGSARTEIGDAATLQATTSSPPASTAPTSLPAPTGLDTPQKVAERIYTAWKAGDRAGALAVAEPAAVDAFFAAAPGDYRLYSGCDTGEFNDSGCLYRGDAGTIQVTMQRRGAAWVAVTAYYSAP